MRNALALLPLLVLILSAPLAAQEAPRATEATSETVTLVIGAETVTVPRDALAWAAMEPAERTSSWMTLDAALTLSPAPEAVPVGIDPAPFLAEIGTLQTLLSAQEGNLIAAETARQEAEAAAQAALVALAEANAALASAEIDGASALERALTAEAALALERAEVARLSNLLQAQHAENDDLRARLATVAALTRPGVAPTTLEAALTRLRQVNVYLAP